MSCGHSPLSPFFVPFFSDFSSCLLYAKPGARNAHDLNLFSLDWGMDIVVSKGVF